MANRESTPKVKLKNFYCYPVELDETVYLEANKEYFVRGILRNKSSIEDMIFVPNVEKLEKKEILSTYALVKTGDNGIPVRILNGENNLTLYKGTTLGNLHPLTKIKS